MNGLVDYLSSHIPMGTGLLQIFSGITRGKMLNGKLYTQSLQKSIYLYLSNTDKLTYVILVNL